MHIHKNNTCYPKNLLSSSQYVAESFTDKIVVSAIQLNSVTCSGCCFTLWQPLLLYIMAATAAFHYGSHCR
jgi:hypothetical protein